MRGTATWMLNSTASSPYWCCQGKWFSVRKLLIKAIDFLKLRHLSLAGFSIDWDKFNMSSVMSESARRWPERRAHFLDPKSLVKMVKMSPNNALM